jgi:hypothetical protein
LSSIKRAGAISERGWAREFEDPIALPDGRALRTLLDAGNYIEVLPRKEQLAPEWHNAVEALLLVAENGGPTMFARIGFMKALNRHRERVFDPSRKDHHWGKRKLKRDE